MENQKRKPQSVENFATIAVTKELRDRMNMACAQLTIKAGKKVSIKELIEQLLNKFDGQADAQ